MPMETLVVTGGSRGIGAEVAKLGAARGYNVCVNYAFNEDAAQDVVDAIKQTGGHAFAHCANTADEAAVEAMFAATKDRYGRVDVLVNNAGIYGDQKRLEELTFDDLDQIFRINVSGYFLCAKYAVRHMAMKNGGNGGRIVNVTSIAGANGGSPGRLHYAASKGAIDTFSLGLAKEVAGDGITVNAFAPGLTDTDLHPPGRLEKLAPTVPLGRAAKPSEMAAGILWLASAEASYCTGAMLKMSGGR